MRNQIRGIKLMDEVVVDNTTVYSDSIKFSQCTGEATVFISSSAGKITVTQQCSNNEVDWYSPIDTSGNPLCVVAAALTVTTGIYVTYNPAIAKFARLSVLEDGTAAATVTIILNYQLEV
jgi:hypothetical protein